MNIASFDPENALHKDSQSIQPDDVNWVIDHAGDIWNKFKASKPLKRFINDAGNMISLVRDYWNGTYRDTPTYVFFAIVAALLYVFNPADFWPDFIPFVGLIDDAMIIAACLMVAEKDIEKYTAWKKQQ